MEGSIRWQRNSELRDVMGKVRVHTLEGTRNSHLTQI